MRSQTPRQSWVQNDDAAETVKPATVEIGFEEGAGTGPPKGEFDHLLTCRQAWDWKSFLILVGILCTAAGHLSLAYFFSSSSGVPLAKLDRPFLWMFLVGAFMFLFVAVASIFCWKKKVKSWLERKYGRRKQTRNKKQGHPIVVQYQRYIDTCGLDGKFYLIRLFALELVENWVQFVNLKTIYLCTLELWATLPMSILLVLESLFRAMRFYRLLRGEKLTTRHRNAQVYFDISIDLIFSVVPLALVYFLYKIDLRLDEVAMMVVPTSLSLFGKFRRMIEETFRNNVEATLLKRQTGKQRCVQMSYSDRVSNLQNKSFPRSLKVFVFGASMIYALLMCIVIVVQSASYSRAVETCAPLFGGDLWDSGCRAKVPFCKSMLEVKCDCAYFHLENHNASMLPRTFTTMTALRKIQIWNGPLQRLPAGMETLTKVSYFEIFNNRLQAFEVDTNKWPELTSLDLYGNNIIRISKSIWTSSTLVNLDLTNNSLAVLPSEGIAMPSLIFLGINNNGVTVPRSFGNIDQFPSLRYMYLNGNQINTLPDGLASFHKTLVDLGVARSNITVFPNYFASFWKLSYVDARDNFISYMSPEITDLWLSKPMVGVYFAGNPVCPRRGLDCKPLCSQICWLRTHRNDGFCDESCFSASCSWDGDDCPDLQREG